MNKLLQKIEQENPDMYDAEMEKIKNPYSWLYEEFADDIESSFFAGFAGNGNANKQIPASFINPEDMVSKKEIDDDVKKHFDEKAKSDKYLRLNYGENNPRFHNKRPLSETTWEQFYNHEQYEKVIIGRVRKILGIIQYNLNILKDEFDII